ncbi:MAG TPA: T9SS type A sorting domain-containing protein [bacterium]|nr:T9SS type A sorting domain-containing protein [bacterium]
MSIRRRIGASFPGLRAVLFAFALSAPAVNAAATPAGSADPDPRPQPRAVGMLAEWFAANPELVGVSGTGSKPYERLAWFGRTRQGPAGRSGGRLRAEASEVGRRRTAPFERSGGSEWFNTGPTDFSGRATALAFDPTDPDVVYTGTAGGGLWKSTDGGDTWDPLTDDQASLSVGALQVLPWAPNVVLLGTGEGQGVQFAGWTMDVWGVGMLRSTDGGQSWGTTSLAYPISGFHGFNAIAVNESTQTILAAATDGLWRSTDDGASWAQVVSPGVIFDVKYKPGDPQRATIVRGRDPFLNSTYLGPNGVLATTDDGLSYAPFGTGLPPDSTIGKSKLAVSADDPSILYGHFVQMIPGSSSSLGTYRSTDDGATWSLRNPQNIVNMQGWYNLALVADPDDADHILAGGVLLYESFDGGSTLTQAAPFQGNGSAFLPHVDNHALVYEPGSASNVWVACDGGVWKSTNDGGAWASRREGIVSYQFYDICVAQVSPTLVVGGTQDNGVPRRLTADWLDPTLVGDGAVCNVSADRDNIIYAQVQTSLHFKSVNTGQSWSAINTGIATAGPFIAPQSQDQTDRRHLYTSANDGIYRTTNGGNLWTKRATHSARWIDISPLDGNVVWTVSNFSGVWLTTNDGATWTFSGTFPANGLETKIHAHPGDVMTALATFGGYAMGGPHLVLTTDSGASWTDVTGDLPDIPVNTVIVDPGRTDDWYAGTDIGVWCSTNGGANWTPFGTSLPNVVVTDLEIRRATRKLVAGTYGRGAWEADLSPAVTAAVDPVPAASVPGLLLDRPYPNPATGPVLLRFAARSPASVSLDLYDVTGRRVARLADESRGDGVIRDVTWRTDDVPSGVYFVVLRTGERSLSRKLVVAR